MDLGPFTHPYSWHLAQHVILTIQCQIGNINKKIHIHYQFYGSEIQNSIFRGKELPDDHHGKTMNKLCKLQHSHLECRWGKRKLPAFSYNLCYRYTPCHHHPPKLNQLPANWINEKADTYSYGIVVLEIISGQKSTDVEVDDDGYEEYLLRRVRNFPLIYQKLVIFL